MWRFIRLPGKGCGSFPGYRRWSPSWTGGIVNSRYVETLDKGAHLVRLSGGETLPISDAWYGRALERLRELKAQNN